MRWKQVDKANRVQNEGVYTDWKQQISDDCYNQCVYCSIHESPWGGIDHYHIEHFRPKSKFKELEHVITNLYHSCPVCNRFKSDDWPDEPDSLNRVCYPDPSDYDYNTLFNLDINNFHLTGNYVASTYLVNRLYLNRPQLVYERRESYLKVRAQSLLNEIEELLDRVDYDKDFSRAVTKLIMKINKHWHLRSEIPPYKLVEIRKN